MEEAKVIIDSPGHDVRETPKIPEAFGNNLNLLREFQSIGCQDSLKIALACRVYNNLKTSARCSNVDKAYNSELDIIFIHGTQVDTTHIFIPLLSSRDCNMVKLEQSQQKLRELYPESTLHLAICDTASNVLYYTIKEGFEDKKDNWVRKV